MSGRRRREPLPVPLRRRDATVEAVLAEVAPVDGREGGRDRRPAPAAGRASTARRWRPAPRRWPTRFAAGGRLLTFGNGGSSTDAADVAAAVPGPRPGRAGRCRRWRSPPTSPSSPPCPTTSASTSSSPGRWRPWAGPGDIAFGISTSGGSENVLRAFEEARRRGLLTVGLAGYDGRPDGRVRASRPPLRRAVGVGAPHPGGADDRLPRAVDAGAGGPRGGRRPGRRRRPRGRVRIRVRVEGIVQGVGFRPFVHAPGRPARPRRLGRQRRPGRRSSRPRATPAALAGFVGVARDRGAAAGRGRAGRPASRWRRVGEARFRIVASRDGRARSRRWSRPTSPPAPTAWPRCATRPPAATATRSPTAPTAGPGSPSSRGVPYDRPLTTMAGVPDVRRLRRASTTTRPTAASTPSRSAARPAARSWRSSTPTARPLPGDDPLAEAAARLRAGRDRGRQGPRRLPPGRPGRRRGGGGPRCGPRKHREDKPFAVMVADVAAAPGAGARSAPRRRRCCRPGAGPIVLLPPAGRTAPVAPSVAPGQPAARA